MVRLFRCSRVLADGASSSSCNTRGVPFSMPKSTSGYSTSNRGKNVVGLLLGAAMCTLIPVAFGVMCKILPSVISSVVGLVLGIATVFSSVRTLSAWARTILTPFELLLNFFLSLLVV